MKVGMVTVEKLTLKNMGITFGILALHGTEPEIHLGSNLPSPHIATYVLKNIIATLGLTESNLSILYTLVPVKINV